MPVICRVGHTTHRPHEGVCFDSTDDCTASHQASRRKRTASVKYRELQPPRDLRPYVRCFWTLSTGPSGIEPVFPDGRLEIVIHRGEPFRQLDVDGVLRGQAPVVVAGQLTRPAWLGPVEDGEVFGIRFRTVGARAILRVPLHELGDLLLPLGSLDPVLADRLRESVNVGPAPERVSRVLLERLQSRRAPHPRAIAMKAVMLLGSGHQVGEVARHLGCSERTLERYLLADVGLSPKVLQRVVRFRSYFAQRAAGVPGSAAALTAGYYDQSHANRDFRCFTGTSARAHFGLDPVLGRTFLSGEQPE